MKKIILDVDTGHDDAIAIEMAAGSSDLEILGIVAVSGNQTLDKTLENTLNLCDSLGIKAPVFRGSEFPLIRQRVVAGKIHGETGFDGPVFGPRKKQAESQRGVDFIVNSVLEAPGEVYLVPTGPLTDIALAMRLDSRVASLVKGIVLMGGSLGKGNVTPSAEFNIYADPEAASIVFSSGAPIVMMGLDVTLSVVLDPPRIQQITSKPGKARSILKASMEFYTQSCLRYAGSYPAMHDPCTIAYLHDPSMFSVKPMRIEVETKGSLTYGRTVGIEDSQSRTLVACKVDQQRFWFFLDSALEDRA